MRLRLDPRYSLITLAYVATIQWLSSVPDLSVTESDPLTRLVMNLGHAPLFAGLAYCVLMSLSRVGERWWERYGSAFAVSAACAVLDEWHQTFVPGREVSSVDLFLDLTGIGGILLVLLLRERRKARRQAGGEAPPDPRAMPPGTRCSTSGPPAIPIPLVAGSNTTRRMR